MLFSNVVDDLESIKSTVKSRHVRVINVILLIHKMLGIPCLPCLVFILKTWLFMCELCNAAVDEALIYFNARLQNVFDCIVVYAGFL